MAFQQHLLIAKLSLLRLARRQCSISSSQTRHLRAAAFFSTAANSLPLQEALCDAHPPTAVALRYQSSPDDAEIHELTYGALSDRSRRLALALQEVAGVQPGDVVAGMLPKGPAIMEVAVATARLGAIYQPLFTAFQSDGIQARIDASMVKAVITEDSHLEKWNKVLQPDHQAMICVGYSNDTTATRDNELPFPVYYYEDLIGQSNSGLVAHQSVLTTTEARPMALLYSSGTTGPPKGILCPSNALENFQIYLEQGLGLTPPTDHDEYHVKKDKYWNIADAGWAYGLYYNVYGPLVT